MQVNYDRTSVPRSSMLLKTVITFILLALPVALGWILSPYISYLHSLQHNKTAIRAARDRRRCPEVSNAAISARHAAAMSMNGLKLSL